MSVPRENLIAQGKAIESYHQRNQDLFAIRSVIPGITAPCQSIRFRLALKIGACNIIEQQRTVAQVPPRQRVLDERLLTPQPIERRVQFPGGDGTELVTEALLGPRGGYSPDRTGWFRRIPFSTRGAQRVLPD
jgi:hypothetical protein